MYITKLTIPFGLLFVLLAVSGMAQDDAPGILTEIGDSLSINSGAVIAFGELIEPPYFVTHEGDKVLINGIVFYPREKDPSKKSPEIAVSDMHIQKHNLIIGCENSYIQNYKLLGREKAKELLLEEYGNDSLITSIEFDDDLLKIVFIDGTHENIFHSSLIAASETLPTTQEQIDLRIREKADNTISTLKNGSMIVFGYEYTVYIPQKGAKEISNVMDKMKRGVVSTSYGENEITRIAYQAEFAMDVINHLQATETGETPK